MRDPDWWQGWEDGPHIDRVIIQWIAEPATVRSMLEQGDAQIVIGLTPEDWNAVSTIEGIATSEHASSLQSLIMPNNQKAPFDNPKVRQALAYAVNYGEIISGIMGGHGVKLDSVVAKPYIGYAPATPQYSYDLEKAKALLAEAGYADGLTMELYALHIFPNDQLILELLQADLASIGVTLDVKTMDPNAFLSKQTSGNPEDAFQGYISNIGGDYPDAYEMLALVYARNNQPPALCCNSEFYGNDAMEEILGRIEAALDPEETAGGAAGGVQPRLPGRGRDLDPQLQPARRHALQRPGVGVQLHVRRQLRPLREDVAGLDWRFGLGMSRLTFGCRGTACRAHGQRAPDGTSAESRGGVRAPHDSPRPRDVPRCHAERKREASRLSRSDVPGSRDPSLRSG